MIIFLETPKLKETIPNFGVGKADLDFRLYRQTTRDVVKK